MPICHNCGAPVGVEGVYGCPNCIKGWEKLYRNSSKGVLKMDCSKTVDFFSEMRRLCDSHVGCLGGDNKCPLYDFCDRPITIDDEDAETVVEILQKWSDEHPRKTYAQDFFDKFPNASELGDIVKCWNEPMDD